MALASCIGKVTGYGHDRRKTYVTSTSWDASRLSALLVDTASGLFPELAEWVQVSEPLDLFPLGATQTLLDAKANQVVTFEPFLGGEQETHLPTPLPSVLPVKESIEDKLFIRSPTWMVDVDVVGHQLPNRSALAPAIHHPSVMERDIRPGKNGTTYYSQAALTLAGVPLEKSVPQPRLVLPDARDAMSLLVQAGGFTSSISQAGRFSEHFIHVFGGLGNAAGVFRDTNPYVLPSSVSSHVAQWA